MNLDMLVKSNRIIFECISGSHAYGTNIATSDKDIRGFYINPSSEYLGLTEPVEQIGDERHDITYYGLKKAFDLLIKANPNMIELLWMPKDCVLIMKPAMEELMRHRDLFISKKCFHTHSGYAYAQIGKAKGQNKMVNHPELAVKPKKEDFCWIIPWLTMDGDYLKNNGIPFPCRPIPLKEFAKDTDCFDLSKCHCSALEHVPNTYRLYLYGDKAKGVFRGDDMLVCESIPMEDENKKFVALLIYNQNEYEKAIIEHRKYNEWIENRNNARWIDQEKGLLNYDQKNMMHCMRLLISGENMLRYGFPLVRFEGEQQKYLMKIRNGEFKYEEIMAEVDKKMAELEGLYKTSHLPHSVDHKKIDELYRELSK